MRSLWLFVGRVVFWATWPYLFLHLRYTSRTRVFIRSGNELLVVKGWLGSGKWSFPGGGLHKGEDKTTGAIREVEEETGIRLQAEDLTLLFEKKVKSRHGLRYNCIAYAIDKPEKPVIKKPSGEITDIQWVAIEELRQMPKADYLLIPALEAWDK